MLRRRQRKPPLGPYPTSNGPARPRPATRTRTSGSKPSTNVSPTPAVCGTPRRRSPPGAPPAAADKRTKPNGTSHQYLHDLHGGRQSRGSQRHDLSHRSDRYPVHDRHRKAKASAVNHEWQTQALAAANTANAQLEGDDAAADATTPTVRLGNICQISRKVPQVSGTQQAVEHAGRDNEMAYQEMLKGLELKRDMEAILVGTNQAKNTGNSSTARVTASVLSWIKSNTSKGAGGADPSAADGTGTRTDGTQRVFTEANLKSVLQSVWNNGGKPDTIMTGGFNKQVL